MSEKTKKGFKMPSSYTVLLIIIAIMAVLTWIIPAGAFVKGVYQPQPQNPQGIWDVLMAPIRAMLGTHPEEGSLIKETSAAIDVAFFILMVGGFLGACSRAAGPRRQRQNWGLLLATKAAMPSRCSAESA